MAAASTPSKKATRVAKRPSSASPDPADEGRLLQVSLQGDREITTRKDDRLETKDLAAGLATILDSQATDTPLTVAVSAPWGAGKSSLIGLVREELDERTAQSGRAPHIFVPFNAWMHDGAADLSGALAAEVARRVNKRRSLWNRVRRPFPAVLLSPRQRAHRRQLIFVIALLIAVPLALLLGQDIQQDEALTDKPFAILGGFAATTLALVVGIHAAATQLAGGLAALVSFVDDPGSASASGAMRDVAEELGRLIRQARVGAAARRANELPRVIVVIDDLERCQPPKAVDMCDVAAQLLNHRGVITILVGDQRIIALSAELRYHEAANRLPDFGQSYLEKVVQFQVELPPLALHRLQALARDLPASQERVDISQPSLWRRGSGRVLAFARHPLRHNVTARLRKRFDLGRRAGQLTRWLARPLNALAGFFILLSVGATVPTAITGTAASRIAAVGLTVVVLAVFINELVARGRRRAAVEKLRGRLVELLVERRVRATFGAGAPDPARWRSEIHDEVVRNLQASFPGEAISDEYDAALVGMIDAEIDRALSESGEVRRRAEAACEAWFPDLPRATKRLMNGLRFLIVVATKRQLLSPTTGVTPEHLGRWMVLRVRWPRVAAAVDRNPAVLTSLEGQTERTLQALDLDPHDVDALGAFLREGDELGPVAHYLVFLDREVPKPPPFKLPRRRPAASAATNGSANQAAGSQPRAGTKGEPK